MPLSTAHKLLLLGQRRQINYAALLENILTKAPGFWLPLADSAGLIADNVLYTDPPSANLLTDPSVEDWASASNLTHYQEFTAGSSTINQETTPELVRTGSSAARLDIDGSGNFVSIAQAVGALGDTIEIACWARKATGAGTVNLSLRPGSATPLEGAYALTETYTRYSLLYPLASSTTSQWGRGGGFNSASIYLDDLEIIKAGELDGLYVGPTLGADTCLGQPAPTFDGTNDYIQGEHNRLEGIFKPETPTPGSRGMAIKISQANWESATAMVFWCMGVDANNVFYLHKPAASTLRFTHILGGTAVSVDYTVTSADHGKWLFPIATWGSDGVTLYVKDTADSDDYSAGTWTSSALTAAFTRTGSMNGSNFAAGSLAQSFYTRQKLSAGQASSLYHQFRLQEANAS